MRLIVTEKNNSAKKIAEILSKGEAKADATYKVPYYSWGEGDDAEMTVGLKGHVLNPAFPEGYSNWQETDPKSLIDAELVTEATDKNVVKAVKKLAKEADSDRDRDRLRPRGRADRPRGAARDPRGQPRASRAPVKRARYSALTKEEIERAFGELDELSYDLAHAGAARQDIDLIWGATLTRAVSLATRRFGSNFLSVGRVQSPTLGLIVERELERRAHVAVALLGGVRQVRAPRRRPSRPTTRPTSSGRSPRPRRRSPATESPGVVKEVTLAARTRASRRRPYNTTAFTTDASSRLGITPVAGDADRRGPLHGRVHLLPAHRQHRLPAVAAAARARHLAGQDPRVLGRQAGLLDGELTPTRGKKETTDHPPIYPTQAVYPNALEGPQRRVYELIVRRFLATFSAADDHRVDPRRHRGRLGDLLRPRLDRRRPRLRRDLHLRPLRRQRAARRSRRARSSTSTAPRGSSTRRPSRRRGSARASCSR